MGKLQFLKLPDLFLWQIVLLSSVIHHPLPMGGSHGPLWSQLTSPTHVRLQKAHEKMLNITNDKRNTNQNYNEISPHTGQNSHHQKIYKQEMLEKVWRKGNSPTLLVGM